MLIYIGRRATGADEGIVAARFDPASGGIVGLGVAAGLAQPTWLQADPKRPVLYAVSETGNDGKSDGAVSSLSIDPSSGRLQTISRVDSAGGGATSLVYDPGLSTVFVANYGGGQVAAIPVGPDGRLSAALSVRTDTGSGPDRRQKGPHAHGVTLDPSGAFLLVPDLGADRIFVYAIDKTTRRLTPAAVPATILPPGSGPRHLVFSPDGRFVFVVTELSGELFSYRWDAVAGRLTPIAHVALDAPGYAGKKSGAEVAVSRDGRFAYASNRGEHMLQVYTVDHDTGGLTLLQSIDCGGEVPWSFTFAPDGRWLLVANQASNRVSVFRADPATGRLAATSSGLAVADPVNVAFTSY